jgi:hypothetical protein
MTRVCRYWTLVISMNKCRIINTYKIFKEVGTETTESE